MAPEVCAKFCAGLKPHPGKSVNGDLLKIAGILILFWVQTAVLLPAQTFTTLHSFAGASAGEGAAPMYGPLVQGLDGNLYGTTMQGGLSLRLGAYCGTVFKISAGGAISTIHRLCALKGCPDGDTPQGGLALNTNGNLYGMTDLGGSVDIGTLFKITPAGALTTLANFTGPNGGQPLTTLIRGSSGSFYGITNSGGTAGEGVILKTKIGRAS